MDKKYIWLGGGLVVVTGIFIGSIFYSVFSADTKDSKKENLQEVIKISEKNTNETCSSSLTVSNCKDLMSSAAFVAQAFFSDTPWKEFNNGTISFNYPTTLFEKKSGLQFFVQTKDEAEEDVTVDTDGTCDIIGDPDCLTWNWNEKSELFQKIVKGQNAQPFPSGYETFSIQQRIKKVGKYNFLVSVDLGKEGGCNLTYVTYQKSTELRFTVNICEDKFLKTYDFKNITDKSSKNDTQLMKWAEDVAEGKPEDFSILVKQQALEKIITNMSVR